MRKFLITICFILFTITAFSQAPGYQGKKLSIYFTLNGFAALQGLNYRTDLATLDNTQDLSVWHLNLNTRKIFDVDYAVSRAGAVGLTLQFLRTGTTTPLNETFVVPNGPVVEDEVGAYVNITSIAPGIYYKFFFYSAQGSIAPLGVYSQIEVLDFINSAPQTRLYEVPLGLSSPVVDYGKVGSCLGITYSVGQQSIFFNRLILNFGIQLGLIPSYLPQLGNSIYDDNGNGNTTSNELPGTNSSLIESTIRARLAGMIFMNVNVGIGLIIL